jgi:SsrA-binding protein
MRHFNRDSRDYHFTDKVEAGLVLTGSDVKSLRTQGVQFQNAHVVIENGLPQLINLNIPLYKFSQNQTIDTTRSRALLLSVSQIKKLQSYKKQKYMFIPISIYLSGKWFKVEIGIGKKIKKYEKRQKIRDKEFKNSSKIS